MKSPQGLKRHHRKMWWFIVTTLAIAYTPDDGTQGYTPYFYKMDQPVR